MTTSIPPRSRSRALLSALGAAAIALAAVVAVVLLAGPRRDPRPSSADASALLAPRAAGAPPAAPADAPPAVATIERSAEGPRMSEEPSRAAQPAAESRPAPEDPTPPPAADTVPPRSALRSGEGRLRGRVARGGRPWPGVRVDLRSRANAATDALGIFDFGAIPAGPVELSVQIGGSRAEPGDDPVREAMVQTALVRSARVLEGEETFVVFDVDSRDSLRVLVRERDTGIPIGRAEILVAVPPFDGPGAWYARPHASARASASGSAGGFVLPEGVYVVAARAPGFAAVALHAVEIGTGRPAAEAVLELPPEAPVTATVRLEGGVMSGLLRVTMLPVDRPTPLELVGTVLDPRGELRFANLGPGRYRAHLDTACGGTGAPGEIPWEPVDVEIPAGGASLDLVFVRAKTPPSQGSAEPARGGRSSKWW